MRCIGILYFKRSKRSADRKTALFLVCMRYKNNILHVYKVCDIVKTKTDRENQDILLTPGEKKEVDNPVKM